MSVPELEQLRHSFAGKRVLITGHTGFKGSWLTYWLTLIGAEVAGYAPAARGTPALFDLLRLSDLCHTFDGDVRDAERLQRSVTAARPDFIFHLAAQPLVRRSFAEPLDTIGTNIMGTANLLEAVRQARRSCVVVVVTSDKCYRNEDDMPARRETDSLGGDDVYSMTKAAAELIAASYRHSYRLRLATARAGNVIGGGDWAEDRIVPDAIRALTRDVPIAVRNPRSVRPWQHVLEPLGGYLSLASRMAEADGDRFCDAWNFGPSPLETHSVEELVQALIAAWGKGEWVRLSEAAAPRESATLRLSIDKAMAELKWQPRWNLQEAVRRTVEWYRAHHDRAGTIGLRELTQAQIDAYLAEGRSVASMQA